MTLTGHGLEDVQRACDEDEQQKILRLALEDTPIVAGGFL